MSNSSSKHFIICAATPVSSSQAWMVVSTCPPHPTGRSGRGGQRIPLMQLQPARTCCCRCHVPTCVTVLPVTIVSVPGATGGAAVKSTGGKEGEDVKMASGEVLTLIVQGPRWAGVQGVQGGWARWQEEGAGKRLLPVMLSGRENGEGAGSGSGHRGDAISRRSS